MEGSTGISDFHTQALWKFLFPLCVGFLYMGCMTVVQVLYLNAHSEYYGIDS